MFQLRPEIKYGLWAVAACLGFGLLTSALPARLSQKDPIYGYGSDSEIYWDLSSNLLAGRGFVHSPGFDFSYIYKTSEYVFDTQRGPGYPFLLAVFRLITSADRPDSWKISLLNAFLVFLNGYFIVKIARQLLPGISSKYFAAVAFFPPFLIYANGINIDFMSCVLLSAFVFCLLRPGRWKYCSAAIGAFAVLTRGNTLFFLLPFWMIYWLTGRELKRKAAAALLGLAMLAGVFCFWSWRNNQLSGYFAFAPFTGLQLRQNYILPLYRFYAVPGQEGYSRWRTVDYLRDRFNELLVQFRGNLYAAEAAMDKEITSDVISLVRDKPFAVAQIYFRSVLQMSVNEYFLFNLARQLNSAMVWGAVWVVAIAFFALPMAGSLCLAAQLFRRRDNSFFATMIYSSSIYILLTAAVWGGFARYQLPISFAIFISSVYWLSKSGKSVCRFWRAMFKLI